MSSDGYDSPAGVDAPLEYISVEDYQWPKPAPAKRSRLDAQERRRRHCECQKRFLARKRRFVEQLHRDVARLELQLKLVETIRETQELQLEHRQLTIKATGDEAVFSTVSTVVDPLDPPKKEHEDNNHDSEPIMRSLDVDGILAELGMPW